MTRTIRTLAANLFVGGAACFAPLVLPATAVAQAPQQQNAVPEAKKLTTKELHAKLLKCSGWVRFEANGGMSHGTGGIIDKSRRLMVTNDHVVEGTDVVWVVFPEYKDGKLIREEGHYAKLKGVKAVVIDRDFARDLAVIQLESLPADAEELKLAADEPDEGDRIRTIGGFTNGGDGLVWGGVHGEVRTVGPQDNRGRGVRHVLSDAGTNGGNSGAPVLNEAGELVGVHCAHKPKAINVAMHVSVKELKAYLSETESLVEPKGAKEFVARGQRKLDAGRHDAAVKDFSAALAKDGTNAHALYLRGKAFTAGGDARTALEDLSAAIKLDGERYEFRVARGVALRALGKADDAMADFSAAIRSDPSQWEGYNQRGLAQFDAGKFADAEDDFGRAIEKGERVALLWANRGEARFSQKKFAAAGQDFAKAADLDPANPGYVMGLGNSLLRLGQAGKAAEVFVEGANRWGNPVFLSKAGSALLAAGDAKQAVKLYSEAIKGFGDKARPTDVASAYMGRGIAQRELKSYKEAIDDLTKAIDLTGGKNGYAYLERGLVYQANGQSNAADDDFKTAEKLGVKSDNVTADGSLLGVWKMTTFANGLKVSQTIEFKKDGTFAAVSTTTSGFGGTTISDTGTWKLEKGKLTVRGKETGTVVRKISIDGDDAQIEMDELGKTVTFSRVK
jgi:tetratricopeptide (TPR) repeat protein